MEQDSREPLEFNVKGPVPILLEEERTDHRSGCSVIDITFSEPVTIGEILFKNYYTAYINLQCKRSQNEEDGIDRETLEWEICVHRAVLMCDPHCEEGSQDYVSITQKQSRLAWLGVVALRLVLRQPSPQWRKFGIENLRIYREAPGSNARMTIPRTLIGDRPVREVGHMDKTDSSFLPAAAHLQNLWAIGELSRASQTDQQVGRFEEPGGYEINYLVYT
ncbi:nicolin-1-like [Limulus polyphemus]|uniref:Nicolin-1-like n=1 Tax=Limulus polyphemus TaxID=6850 RepID=A0ABM1S3F4_LIMPO|nr:nicolin-1-like [Limulus polyphemus]